MPQLITLSRAARLVGVKRGALQKRIQDGEIATFEGKIEISQLLSVYPEAQIENTAMLDKLERIKEDALRKIVRDHTAMPDSEMLGARAGMLTSELLSARQQIQHYQTVIEQLQEKWTALVPTLAAPDQQPLTALHRWFEDALNEPPQALNVSELMLAREAVLRIIAANVRTVPGNHEFFVEGKETILEAALRSGLSFNYGCNDGTCGLCRGKIVSGEARQIHAHEYVLSNDEVEQGYVLTCCNTAVTDLTLEILETNSASDLPKKQLAMAVKSITKPNDHVAIIHLSMLKEHRLRFLSGQKAYLSIGDLQASEYSIASCPCDDRTLSFHVAYNPSVPFSDFVHRQIQVGDIVNIEGPHGSFGLIKDSPRSAIFIAGDTGFAAIKSLIEHALASDMAESIILYWAASQPLGHYSNNLCRSWMDALDNFRYIEWIINKNEQVPLTRDESLLRLADQIITSHSNLDDYDIYIAAPTDLTDKIVERLREINFPSSQLLIEAI